jgi:NADPH2:quinone reductase
MAKASRLPASMPAIPVTTPGGPEVLRVVASAVPKPGRGQVLIQVAAAGVNRADCVQREGRYAMPPDAPDVPGLEVSGTVIARGAGVTSPKLGAKVCALIVGGGYAAYALAEAGHCLPVPKGVSLADAAGLPEVYLTVWANLIERGGLKKGDVALIHGGGSGIGTAAIQLARALGARVFAIAGSPEKCAACKRLGAHRAIDYLAEDFVKVVRSETKGHGADVILDIVGGPYVERNIAVAAPEARIVNLAFLQGARMTLDLGQVQHKHLWLTGSRLRSRWNAEKTRLTRAVAKGVWPLFAKRKLRAVTDVTFSLAQAADAHRRMEASAHIGKILLVP